MPRSFFRAVPKQGFVPGAVHTHRATVRVPVNIPYVVDNLWEYLRPADKPSRRHAVYGSPTPEQACRSAGFTAIGVDDHVVGRVLLAGPHRLVQLDVADARQHPDVRLLPRRVLAVLGAEFEQGSLQARSAVAPLFLPALTAADMRALGAAVPQVAAVLEEARQVSTFWASAQPALVNGYGEVFFDLAPEASYTLAVHTD